MVSGATGGGAAGTPAPLLPCSSSEEVTEVQRIPCLELSLLHASLLGTKRSSSPGGARGRPSAGGWLCTSPFPSLQCLLYCSSTRGWCQPGQRFPCCSVCRVL